MSRVSEPKPKSFEISKWVVWEAYRRVKANKGAPGVDEQSIEEFEQDLSGNLYKLWNRLSSGSYFPPPVRAVEIPKKDGSSRLLGVPTVADRIAQVVVRAYLEPLVEPVFHDDSYGYRPGRSAHDALGVCRERCWRNDWVLDMDIRKFFDTVPWNLVLKAVAHHTDQRWILLYVERWLKAPLQREDGTLVERDRGTPQGSAISPLLANMFMHYAFDAWMAREFPTVPFERYCDDIIVHARSERQAQQLRASVAARLAECGLQLNEQKTRIVYCKDDDRRGSYEHTSFDFLGYTFRPRLSKNRFGKHFLNFTPAVSNDAKTAMRREMRRWRLHLRPDKTLTDLARMFNIVLQGWLGRRRGAVSALRLMVSSPPPAEPDMPIPEHPALHRTCAGRSLTRLGNGGLRPGGGLACSGGRPRRGFAASAIAGHRNLGGPVKPSAFGAGPVASPVPSLDLFPGQVRVLPAKPADDSPPQVVAEVSEAALRRTVAVVVGPTPEFGVERADQLVEREVHHVALGQRLDAVLDVPERAVAGKVIATGARPGLGTRLTRQPRKSNPSSTWVIAVFSGESVNRICSAMNSVVCFLSASV